MKTTQVMVQDLEKPVLELKIGTVVTRSEFEEMQKKSELFSNIDGTSVLYTFFDVADIEDKSKQEFEVLGNNPYPTIFDESILIAKAYIETTVYDLGGSRTDTRIILHIEEEYVGDDNEMSSFDRGYLFESNNNNEWQLVGFSGTVNLLAK